MVNSETRVKLGYKLGEILKFYFMYYTASTVGILSDSSSDHWSPGAVVVVGLAGWSTDPLPTLLSPPPLPLFPCPLYPPLDDR